MIKDKILNRSRGILKTRILRSKIGTHTLRNVLHNTWVRLSILLIVIAIMVRSFLWQPFAIPSQSMLPTIIAGDYIFANKRAYGYNRYSLPYEPRWFPSSMNEKNIRRGDVIVYRGNNKRHYIKRIIGMPGDRIQMLAGVVQIDGLAVSRTRVTDFMLPETENSPCLKADESRRKTGALRAVCHYPRYKETMPGNISYMTLDLTPSSEYDTSKLVMVPPRNYYVMGDNRDFSLDSRVSAESGAPALVELGQIIGKAEMVFMSLDGSTSWLKDWPWRTGIRSDRMLKSVNE